MAVTDDTRKCRLHVERPAPWRWKQTQAGGACRLQQRGFLTAVLGGIFLLLAYLYFLDFPTVNVYFLVIKHIKLSLLKKEAAIRE